MTDAFLSTDAIRTLFSRAMSVMYRNEVPAYGTLLDLVQEINTRVLAADPQERARLQNLDQLERISEERHGAIRLGTAAELATMRRLFGVMGMYPVGYYDLSVAGVPVHSTAFRPLEDAALARNPFRVFTSLLRLDLLDDAALRQEATRVLDARQIYTAGCLELIAKAERQGGLGQDDAEAFVAQALETFRWHAHANVSHAFYRRLHDTHRLVADVVAFKGPHINHLTPRTLDIDTVQRMMPQRGIVPKAVIEGPPARRVPILLRQTSFKALEEPVIYNEGGEAVTGHHTARFGEIEQRGQALTPKGQALYDRLLNEARAAVSPRADGSNGAAYMAHLAQVFAAFPDDLETIRAQGLGYFRYTPTGRPAPADADEADPEALIRAGVLRADPIIYEDFLPVSAAGIFQSNLGDGATQAFGGHPSRASFEVALGAQVIDPHSGYAQTQEASLAQARMTMARS